MRVMVSSCITGFRCMIICFCFMPQCKIKLPPQLLLLLLILDPNPKFATLKPLNSTHLQMRCGR